MDFSSALRPDVYRAVTTTLIPGFVGVAPWVGGVFWPELQVLETWSNAAFPIAATLLALVLVAGFIFEDLGSRVELVWADRWLARKAKRLAGNWRRYLRQKRTPELIAQGYLRALLLRFKFELSMIPATISSLFGLTCAEIAGHGFGLPKTIFLCTLLLLLLVWLLYEIRGGAAVLARTREIIIRSSRLCPR